MTRINANIPVENLVDKHLFVEFREITRVPAQLRKRLNSGKGLPANMPQKLKLGSGHQSFFLDKGEFLHKRYNALRDELYRRNYMINAYFDWEDFYSDCPDYYNDYEMSIEENEILIERLTEKLHTMSNLKYYKKPISTEDAIAMLRHEPTKILVSNE